MNLPDFLTQDQHGRIHLTGHRIGVWHIVDLYNDAFAPETIHEQFPTVGLALVQKVITFYLENRVAIDAYVQRSRESMERQATLPQPGPNAAELRRRMDAHRPKESA